MLQAAIHHLEQERAKAGGGKDQQHSYDDGMHHFRHRMEELTANRTETTDQTTARKILLEAYRAERDKLVDLRATSRGGNGVYRVLERELDLVESRLESQG